MGFVIELLKRQPSSLGHSPPAMEGSMRRARADEECVVWLTARDLTGYDFIIINDPEVSRPEPLLTLRRDRVVIRGGSRPNDYVRNTRTAALPVCSLRGIDCHVCVISRS